MRVGDAYVVTNVTYVTHVICVVTIQCSHVTCDICCYTVYFDVQLPSLIEFRSILLIVLLHGY